MILEDSKLNDMMCEANRSDKTSERDEFTRIILQRISRQLRMSNKVDLALAIENIEAIYEIGYYSKKRRN